MADQAIARSKSKLTINKISMIGDKLYLCKEN